MHHASKKQTNMRRGAMKRSLNIKKKGDLQPGTLIEKFNKKISSKSISTKKKIAMMGLV